MKAFVIVAIVACGLLLSGCVFVKIKDNGEGSQRRVAGNGVITEKEFEVGPFSCIRLNVPADITYETSDNCALSVTMDENLFEYLTVSVENGTLKIGSTTSSFRNFKKLAMRVSSPSLERLICSGAVDFDAPGVLRGADFRVEADGAVDISIANLDVQAASFEVNGAGDIDANLVDVQTVKLAISGAGDAKLTGKAETVKVEVNGAGDVDLSRLSYQNLEKRVNGMGSVKTGSKSRL